MEQGKTRDKIFEDIFWNYLYKSGTRNTILDGTIKILKEMTFSDKRKTENN